MFVLQLRIGLNVAGANWYIVDKLEYQMNIFEYRPGKYGIIGGMCGLVLLVAVIAGICVRRRLQKQRQDQKRHCTEMHVESEDDESGTGWESSHGGIRAMYLGSYQTQRRSNNSGQMHRSVIYVLVSLKLFF
jgi:hypothetical protein